MNKIHIQKQFSKSFVICTIQLIKYLTVGMAENNAVRNRKLRLNKDTAFAAAAIYKQLYGKMKEDDTPFIPATFQIIYLLGWKPDASQPKPLERGSGQVSLKDLYKLDEIIKETEKVKIDKDK